MVGIFLLPGGQQSIRHGTMNKPNWICGATKYIGVPRKRGEDPQLLMGQAKYIADIKLPGMANKKMTGL